MTWMHHNIYLWNGYRRSTEYRYCRYLKLQQTLHFQKMQICTNITNLIYNFRLPGWSGTGRRLCRDLSATKSVAARFLCKHKNLAATDLVATRSPISRRLLCNLAGTDRGPCCDLCDWCKLSVAERSQSGCNVCLTGALGTAEGNYFSERSCLTDGQTCTVQQISLAPISLH